MRTALPLLAVILASPGCEFDPSFLPDAPDRLEPSGPSGGLGTDPSDPRPEPASDGDLDGVADADDNCVATANAGQFDEDGDGFGDACDNCPHVANVDQLDETEIAASELADGVGDACDPRPDDRDVLVLFEGFNAPLSQDWDVDGGDTWVVDGGSVYQTEETDLRILYNVALTVPTGRVVADVVYLSMRPPFAGLDQRAISVVGEYELNGELGEGVGCSSMSDWRKRIDDQAGFVTFNGPSYAFIPASMSAPQTTSVKQRLEVEFSDFHTNKRCIVDGTADSKSLSGFGPGGIALATFGSVAEIPYVAVYRYE